MSVFTNPAASAPGQAAAYIAAILDLLGDRDPMEVLRQTTGQLQRALDRLPPDLVTTPEAPGKWSVRELLQHLADSEVVWAWRMRLVLAQDRPVLTGYDQDRWARRLRYDEADAKEALAQFTILRRGNLRLLERASAEDLQRVGLHAERGEESVAHMRRLYAGHDLVHLRQLARITAGVGSPSAA
jgi:uncharacterized damage-inducible protein DinB